MSRFFAGSDSDSDSSSEEEQIQRPTAPTYTVSIILFKKNCLMFIYSQFSDDEEEVKRVVRSTKEKRYEELTNIIKQIRNHKKIKDMSSMLSSKLSFVIFVNILLRSCKLPNHFEMAFNSENNVLSVE